MFQSNQLCCSQGSDGVAQRGEVWLGLWGGGDEDKGEDSAPPAAPPAGSGVLTEGEHSLYL